MSKVFIDEEVRAFDRQLAFDFGDAPPTSQPTQSGAVVCPPNPKQMYGDQKVPLHLVPPALMIHAARALEEGAEKYGAYNFRVSGVQGLTYVGAMLRHLFAYLDGEDIDPESVGGKLHLDGVAASLAILLDATDNGTLIDNRPPKGPAGRLVRSP